MKIFPRIWLFLAILAVSTGLLAQEQLPKRLEGDWQGVSTDSRHNQLGGSISVTIEKQNSNGSIEGKMTYQGAKRCEATDGPMTGQYDGQVLTLHVTLNDKFPNAGCGRLRFVLRRNADGRFDGEVPGSNSQIKASLSPR
jgi:hypothetical protein